MSTTDGLMRGMEVIDTRAPLSPIENGTRSPIHEPASALVQLEIKLSIFET
ncbi:hypothetical protein SLEP1_g8735 [Rubroshorea leprosula]|uniref:Uncharacterized protein n=1 Tax=Rubroshorea leprosula TaxID=152421 RepID=A0AAV5IBS4_9ROSI|nr:hypothetical protein SLEP1_g8735 [Rubroshorea leprosula]